MKIRIRKPRNITGTQLGLVTVLGVLGGIYIWRPYLNQLRQQQASKEEAPVSPGQ